MSTDLNWQELIDRSIGDGPGHRPMPERLAVGRRALRRRQLAVVAATALVAVVAGGAVWVAAPGETGTGAPVSSNPDVRPDHRPDGQETDGQKTDGQKTNGAPVHLGEGETLIAAPGVTILDQQPHPDLPRNFAGPDDRSAAAWIEVDSERSFVLVRETYGEEQAIPWTKGDFDSLEAFLAFAKQRYESEVGLL